MRMACASALTRNSAAVSTTIGATSTRPARFAGLAAPRVRQEVVDQRAHAFGSATDDRAEFGELFFRRVGVRHGDLEVGADHRERVAQLVRCLLDEPPLALEGRVEARQHRVERVGQPSELVVRPAKVDAPRQVGRLDLARHPRDAPDRTKDDAGSEPTDAEAADEQHAQRHERVAAQIVERSPVDPAL